MGRDFLVTVTLNDAPTFGDEDAWTEWAEANLSYLETILVNRQFVHYRRVTEIKHVHLQASIKNRNVVELAAVVGVEGTNNPQIEKPAFRTKCQTIWPDSVVEKRLVNTNS